jgi:hypothetical protein
LSFLALGVAVVACWHGRAALAGAVGPWRAARLRAVPGLAALGVVLGAVAMDLAVRPRVAALPSGGSMTVAGGSLDHLGLSRYEDDDSQVLALALERRAGGGTRLSSAEHREYADSRGGLLGGLVRIPAMMPGVFTSVVWLEEVQARDDVTVAIIDRSPLTWWWLALALGTLALSVSSPRREQGA